MRIGFLSDAHGNPEGLNTAYRILLSKGVDKIYFLGDAVGYFSQWNEVLQFLNEHKIECVQGNHDQIVLENKIAGLESGAYQMRSEYRARMSDYLNWISTWPVKREFVCGSKRLMLVHGSPLDPIKGYIYPWTDLSVFGEVDADVIVFGHTHRPFVAKNGTKTFFNVGSCGLPRDVGNLLSCGVFDEETGECEVYRSRMDIERILRVVATPHADVLACLERRADSFVGTEILEQSE